MKHFFLGVALAACLALAPITATAQPAVIADAATIQNILDRYSPSLVSIRFVQVMRYGNRENENQIEVPGVVVGEDGLIMTMRVYFNPMDNDRGEEGPEFAARNVRVLIGSGGQEYAAEVVAGDPDLGLAWLRITDELDQALQPVDFAAGRSARVGERYLGFARLGASYGRAPVTFEGMVSGRVNIPRPMFTALGEFGLAVGADSQVIGFIVPRENRGDTQPGSLSAALTQFLIAPEAIVEAMERVKN